MDLRAEDQAASRGILYRRARTRPKVGVHIMHPRTDQTQNYNILPLAAAGYAVLGRAGRWVASDINTIHERLMLDVAAGVRRLHEVGCEEVILLGNSGGGALGTMYQAQASKAPAGRYAETPAGDPCDLGRYALPRADGIVLIGAHPGEGFVLSNWLDASLTDEDDPFSVDPSLDIYDFDNGFRIPPKPSSYDPAFIERCKAARRARVERLEAIAFERIRHRQEAAREAKAAGDDVKAREAALRRAAFGNHMIIHRALADPRWLDPTIDPDDRDICSYSSHPRPDLANYGTFQSFVLTPEAYLSTWSGASSRANTADRLAEIADPLIMVHYAGDSVCRMSEARMMFDAAASPDKTLEIVPGLDHYGFPITGPHERAPRDTGGTDRVVAWMAERFPV